MALAKSTKWGNKNINTTMAHKKYICDKSVKQYWFNCKPKNFKQQWQNLIFSSLTHNKSSRVDYRFVFSVKNTNKTNLDKLYACVIQFQKHTFFDYMGLFAIHKGDNNYHVHFLLNPIDISDTKRKFHRITPTDYQKIKDNWFRYLNIFNLSDEKIINKYKQRTWGNYYRNRKFDNHNSRYNLEVRDKFISQFFNPVLKFINKNTNNNFRLLEKKKYRENNKYKYYQTSDLVQTVDKLKKKWNEIEWALALKKLNSKGAIEFFESVFKITEKNKIKQSFPVIFNNFNDKYKNIDSLFYEYDCFQKQLQNYEDAYEIENLSLTR